MRVHLREEPACCSRVQLRIREGWHNQSNRNCLKSEGAQTPSLARARLSGRESGTLQ